MVPWEEASEAEGEHEDDTTDTKIGDELKKLLAEYSRVQSELAVGMDKLR